VRDTIDAASPSEAKDAIDYSGEGVIQGITEGLPKELAEKYLEDVKDLKNFSPEETRDSFKRILDEVKVERKRARLTGDPLEKKADEELGKDLLSDKENEELNRLQQEGAEKMRQGGLTGEGIEGLVDSGEGVSDQLSGVSEKIRRLPSDPEQKRIEIGKILGDVDLNGVSAVVLGPASGRSREFMDNLKKDLEKGDVDSALRSLKQIDSVWKMSQRENSNINSIEDLAKYIVAKQNKELWGEDGELPIINKKGEFSQANFILWLREQSVALHWDNPNGKMAPLESVGIQNVYGSFIPIYLMTRFKEQYLKDEKTGRVLTDLSNQLVYEAFMFGDWRNGSLLHRQSMRNDQELPKVEQEWHATNNLTRGRNLKFLLEMPAEYGKEGDTRMGDAIRFGNDFFYNLSDKEKLSEVVQRHPLTKTDFKNALRILQDKFDWDEELDDFGNFYDSKTDRFIFRELNRDGSLRSEESLFDSNGNINMEVFVKNLNFFKSPGELSSGILLVREVLRIKMAQNSYEDLQSQGGKRVMGAGIAFTKEEKEAKEALFRKEEKDFGFLEAKRRFMLRRKAERINVDEAEVIAYSAQHPFGGAARGDVDRVGFNADAKLNVQDYALKQSSEHRGGATGLAEVLGVTRSLSTDYWTGLRTESGETPYEIFEQIRQLENRPVPDDPKAQEEAKDFLAKEKKRLIDKLTFREDEELNFTSNQRFRAFEMFHQQLGAKEHIDLNKIVTWSPFEGVKLQLGEFQEQINEKLIKPKRYAFLNANLKYSQMVRRLDPATKEYETVTLAEYLHGDEVLNQLNLKRDSNGEYTKESKDYLDTPEGKTKVFKGSVKAEIAGEIRFHRTMFGSVGQFWGYTRTESFIKALKTIKEIVPDPDHPGRYIATGNRFFSEADIEWIRKNSRSEVWRMLAQDAIREGGPGFAGGLWKGLTIFAKSLAK
jgi:hypothetical protein